jgi:ribonucleoside-diphosphate reductase alpha chain
MTDELSDELFYAIYSLEIMPSMRSLMTAGPALERDHVAGYNCAYTAIDGKGKVLEIEHPELDDKLRINVSKPHDFDEIMYILLCGTGVGFSVERQYVRNLPKVGKKLNRRGYLPYEKNYPGVPTDELSTIDRRTENKIQVVDSKYGWASALRILITELYNGNFDVQVDTSKIRPAGSVLKTFGGRASGPEPLVELVEFTRNLFRNANGRRLTSLECHDLVCKIASIVVVGGVRRSALISLSNPSDDRMRTCKSGAWWLNEEQRALANNSAAYDEVPEVGKFIEEFKALYDSKSGERGIFSRLASQKQAARNGRRDPDRDFGTNPCSEIILRSKQFCNLTEVVVRSNDDYFNLSRKVELATILGTLQATLTDFKYLQPEWRKNTEEERLLGVSLTGIMDHPVLNGTEQGVRFDGKPMPNFYVIEDLLEELRFVAIKTNEEWADRLGINRSAAITCVKPSGTVSQLVDSASGIHPRYSRYYLRTVRSDRKDPLTQFMIDEGFYYEDDVMNPSNVVFYFPMKAPENAICAKEMGALAQLKLWLTYQHHWCEHKPSMTVYYSNGEFLQIQEFVYAHFGEMSGVSFLPYSDHTYKQAPYQEITEEEYNRWVRGFQKGVDWSLLAEYETGDATTGSQEMACVGSSCEIS